MAWDKAEVVKGDAVRVVGRLRNNRYTRADGTESIYYDIVASEVDVLDR